MCVSVRVLVVAALCAFIPLTTAQEDQPGYLHGILNRRDCGRKGLCPYVKRLIPHLSSHGVDNGLFNPHSNEPPSLCGNLCSSDHSCPGYQKCCPTNCGYACFDPVFVVEY